MDEDEEREKKEKSKSNSNKSNKKSGNNSAIKSTKNKSRDKSSSIKKRTKRDSSSSHSNNAIEGPLSDETIVITGEFDLKRDELTNILKSLGARVTGSVSSRTTILLHGDQLEDGRPVEEGRKYKQDFFQREINI